MTMSTASVTVKDDEISIKQVIYDTFIETGDKLLEAAWIKIDEQEAHIRAQAADIMTLNNRHVHLEAGKAVCYLSNDGETIIDIHERTIEDYQRAFSALSHVPPEPVSDLDDYVIPDNQIIAELRTIGKSFIASGERIAAAVCKDAADRLAALSHVQADVAVVGEYNVNALDLSALDKAYAAFKLTEDGVDDETPSPLEAAIFAYIYASPTPQVDEAMVERGAMAIHAYGDEGAWADCNNQLFWLRYSRVCLEAAIGGAKP